METTRASVSVCSCSRLRHSPSEAVVEAFHEPVLPRAARFDVEGPNLLAGQPLLHRLRDELRPVVAPQTGRSPMLLDNPSQLRPPVSRSSASTLRSPPREQTCLSARAPAAAGQGR